LKGGDLILDIASRNKHLRFYIAGCIKEDFEGIDVPKNLNFSGFLTKDELREEYSKSLFHFQLSIFEGVGLSLCEAMLCGCIPIGSSVNEITKIIGQSGFILEKKVRMI
jgi:glycosyltransferase involved in cell wall biosynthesis